MYRCNACGNTSEQAICPYCKGPLYQFNQVCPRCYRGALLACPYCRTPYSYHPSTSRPQNRQNEGCFIATAAYGTPFTKEINILRLWRDDVLKSHFLGLEFIKIYYRISPSIANIISENNFFRKATRLLLTPITTIIKKKYNFK